MVVSVASPTVVPPSPTIKPCSTEASATTTSAPAGSARSAAPASAAKEACADEGAAAAAIKAQANQSKSSAVLSPSMDAIMRSYALQGNNDVDLLKALLHAKAKEDERLAALDLLRVEQLRAANTLAMHQAWWIQAQMQQARAAGQSHAPSGPFAAAYSPTSPPASGTDELPSWQQLGQRRLSSVPPYTPYPPTMVKSVVTPPKSRDGSCSPPLGASAAQLSSARAGSSYKRPRAASTVSNSSSRSSASTTATSVGNISAEEQATPAAKKVKRGNGAASAQPTGVASSSSPSASASISGKKKASHEEVMSALRAKCERNISSNKSKKPRALAPRPASATPIVPATSVLPKTFPAPSPVPMAVVPTPTASAPSPRRVQKSASPPLRRTAIFTAADEQIAAGSLRMLIHATTHVSAPATSDIRSAAVESN